MIYGTIISAAGIGTAALLGVLGTGGSLPVVITVMFFTIAITTLTWNLQPPAVLLLASSAPGVLALATEVRLLANGLGLRTVYLLDGRLASGMEAIPFSMDNLRTLDGSQWGAIVHELCVVCPFVIIDTRVASAGVVHEVSLVIAESLFSKVLFVVDESGNAPALIQARAMASYPLRVATPSVLTQELMRTLPHLRDRVLSSGGVERRSRVAEETQSACASRSSWLWRCARVCGSVVFAVFGYAILTAPIVNAPRDCTPAEHTQRLAEQGQRNVIVLRHEANAEEATWGVRVAGGTCVGIALCLIIWALAPRATRS
jgi:hypothetical protein